MGVEQAKGTAWKWFSKYIRLRDCLSTTKSRDFGKCCSCGIRKPFGELQAGHYIPGRHNAVLFDETGVHAQCVRCNHYLSGNVKNYYHFMIMTYGDETTAQKEIEAKQIVKYTESDLRDIAKKYRILYNELNEENEKTNNLPLAHSEDRGN